MCIYMWSLFSELGRELALSKVVMGILHIELLLVL